MRRPSRQLNIFSISSLDLFASAMGAFIILAVILFPYYLKKAPSLKELKGLEDKLHVAKKTIDDLENGLEGAENQIDTLKPKDIEVVFVCDTTGSMQGHIDGIKANLKDVVDILRLVNKRTRVGFVAYKDIVERGAPNSYLTKTFPLKEMNDSAFLELNNFVDELTAFVVNNQDQPESLSYGLTEAINMPWANQNGKRIIVVITDASAKEPQKTLQLAAQFHQSGSNSKVTAILAKTESADPQGPEFLSQLAQQGNGEYLEDSGRMMNSLIHATLSD